MGAYTQGCAGHLSAGAEQLHCASLIWHILHLIIISSFLICSIKLSLSQTMSSTFFLILSPVPL